ncbi:hypothetical protein DPMN_141032 [Dreissena polymorpha]|uniref:Uncharacterized protein n=1 Tax=Dreissena polymorpha TaxID=45954 RepID=A0A9D4G8N1_DREPO|nr:hypothetical protein DPMN_141032 [Dreissena polymorpha]
MGQSSSNEFFINMGDYILEMVDDFTYHGSTISRKVSIDTELCKRIGKASATMAKSLGEQATDT